VALIRSLHVAVAKSIHTPARRSRDDPSGGANPTLGMKSAALCLAAVLAGNLQVGRMQRMHVAW
jgi:hypothetical protein